MINRSLEKRLTSISEIQSRVAMRGWMLRTKKFRKGRADLLVDATYRYQINGIPADRGNQNCEVSSHKLQCGYQAERTSKQSRI